MKQIFSQGNPFMESLRENKALLYSMVGSAAIVLALTMGLIPELAAQVEVIDFPSEVSKYRNSFSLNVNSFHCSSD